MRGRIGVGVVLYGWNGKDLCGSTPDTLGRITDKDPGLASYVSDVRNA